MGSTPKSLRLKKNPISCCLLTVIFLLIITTTLIALFVSRSSTTGAKQEGTTFDIHDLHISPYSQSHDAAPQLIRRADWNPEETISYCSELMNNPLPYSRDCRFDWRSENCANTSSPPLMFSQYLQDFYLYTRHFKNLGRPGVYVDIATNDPIYISNTFFFDKCLGWGGICVEANHNYFEPIFQRRSCRLVPTCVGSKDGVVVDFALMRGFGGIMDEHYKGMKRVAEAESNSQVVEKKRMRCTTMERVFDMHAVKQIDFMSLDVEGHELEVLKGFNLTEIQVNVMSVEGTQRSLLEIEEYLKLYMYKRHNPPEELLKQYTQLTREDAIFLHESVTFGSPE